MSKRKLLLADDSMTIQKVVNLTFADEGIEVFTVGNGNLAIEKLSEIEPDLVLADVHMPGLNGYEVCEQIRMNPHFKDVPVMLLVGSFEPFDEREAQRVGANDFLTKPFQSIRQLIQKVTTLLDNQKGEANGDNALGLTSDIAADAQTSEGTAPPIHQEDFYIEEPTALSDDLSSSSHGLSDTALDDEMIETSSGSNFDNNFYASIPPIEYSEQSNSGENDLLLVAGSQGGSETPTSDQITMTEEPPLEMRNTEPLSYDDIQDINSSMLPQVAPEKQDEWQSFGSEEVDVADKPDLNADFLQTLTPNDLEQYPSSGKFDHEVEVELDLPPTEEKVFQNSDFELISDEETREAENSAPVEIFDFSPVGKSLPVENESNEPLELDLDGTDLLQFDDEESILDLQNEDAVDEMAATDFEVLPPMHEAIARQHFNEPTINTLTQVGNQAVANMSLGFPPEVIEAIAQLVVEKLSDKVIEKIAWEIVPDRFDLIVRKQMEKRDR